MQSYPQAASPQRIPCMQATDLPATESVSPTVTFTPKPPLEEGAWMNMPAVPTEISDSMRAVYELGWHWATIQTVFRSSAIARTFPLIFLRSSTIQRVQPWRGVCLSPADDRSLSGFLLAQSLAVKGGFNVAAILSPLRADPKSCNKNKSPLDCELRTWRPSIVFVSMETWWSEKPAEEYDKYMRRVIERILETGAVPIIATKADNLEGDHGINATIAQIAYEYDIPLWNFWAAVQPLPNHGLSGDNFHLTFARNFFDDPVRMKSAWPWRNLTALQTLDIVRKGLIEQP